MFCSDVRVASTQATHLAVLHAHAGGILPGKERGGGVELQQSGLYQVYRERDVYVAVQYKTVTIHGSQEPTQHHPRETCL
jgi:hypothetical protein